jgi:hypothetical protein
MLGIIKNKELWMSHIICMNDSEEYEHGLKYFIDAIHNRHTAAEPSEHVKGLYDKTTSRIIRHMSVLKNIPPVFVSCFSGASDALMHWTEYGQHGVGYAIGFDSQKLVSSTIEKAILLRCIYKDDEKQKILLDTLVYAESLLFDLINQNQHIPASSLVDHFIQVLYETSTIFATFFKNEVFEVEQEWRIVTWMFEQNPNIKFEARRNEVRKIYVLPIAESGTSLPVSEIKIGSNRDARLREISAIVIEEFLKSQEIENVKVTPSKSPYRSR